MEKYEQTLSEYKEETVFRLTIYDFAHVLKEELGRKPTKEEMQELYAKARQSFGREEALGWVKEFINKQ